MPPYDTYHITLSDFALRPPMSGYNGWESTHKHEHSSLYRFLTFNKKALNEARWSPTDRKVRQTDTRSTKRGTGRALTWRALARAALAPKVLTPQITQAVRGIRPACRRSGHLPPSSWPIGQRAGEPSERAKRHGCQELLWSVSCVTVPSDLPTISLIYPIARRDPVAHMF